MNKRHIALIVEDDKETAEDLRQILESCDCDGIVVDNRDDALEELQNNSFCFVLLDLQIKSAADSIRGHIDHGKGLLRKIREKYGEHRGTAFWLPVLIVSGFAREVDEAVDVMKDGASDVIQKPLENQHVSERIRQALQASGRQSHEQCHQAAPAQSPNLKDGIIIAIPGNRIKRRTRVIIASKSIDLPDASLKILLRLMVAQRKGERVHKIDFGATEDQGFKGISTLRNELKPAMGDADIIQNDYHGNYSLVGDVRIGECAIDKLLEIGDHKISELATELQDQAPRPTEKV
jgi:DNA-binding response OmpR family regulator